MKFFHLSDLHIGRKLYGKSLREDQEYTLERIAQLTEERKPDAVLLAGDVYDRSEPSAESVLLLDAFLTRMSALTKVILISGNHDSPERLAFGQKLLSLGGVYVSPVYRGKLACVKLTDPWGPVRFYLMPFLRPSVVRSVLGREEIRTYTDAVRAALEETEPDYTQRNVLLSHQFVTGAGTCDSEEISVGGLEQVDGAVYGGFDYVALGHLHTPQDVKGGAARIRYCGTPLKYSFSEERDEKSITQVELQEKGQVQVSCIPLKPLRELSSLKGSYDALTQLSFYENSSFREHYLQITLTDEEEILNGFDRLRTIYPNLLRLEYRNSRSAVTAEFSESQERMGKSPLELFEELYELQNNAPMSPEQIQHVSGLIREIGEEFA